MLDPKVKIIWCNYAWDIDLHKNICQLDKNWIPENKKIAKQGYFYSINDSEWFGPYVPDAWQRVSSERLIRETVFIAAGLDLRKLFEDYPTDSSFLIKLTKKYLVLDADITKQSLDFIISDK